MAKGSEKRTERFSMRLPASVHARLLGVANADHRSMADVALIAIEKYLDALESPQAKKRWDARGVGPDSDPTRAGVADEGLSGEVGPAGVG